MTNPLIIWDGQDGPTKVIGTVLLWHGYPESDQVYSVPRYLEVHAERLRAKYLEFIHDLGESRVAGKRVIDHLAIESEFSLWWMTTLAEKSPFKSPKIYDCLRLLALEEMLLDRRPEKLLLRSGDSALAQAVRGLCSSLEIDFVWNNPDELRPKWSLRRLYRALPYFVQGVISLHQLIPRWRLRAPRSTHWFSGENAVFFCSYFIHLDPEQCEHGRFHSRQWEGLPQYFHDCGRRSNWIQHFMVSAVVPETETGIKWISNFNRDAQNQGCHAFLDSYLTVWLVFAAFNDWLRLIIVSWRLRRIESAFFPAGSAAWLWPFLRGDWKNSLNGPVSLENCLWLALFDAALADIPPQSLGLYLYENQAWEKALLKAWRKHGHGEIVGVQHTTVPFWHLYYFEDTRTFISKGDCHLPMPDRLAVNNSVAHEAFIEMGYPEKSIVEVEALRYLKLADVASRHGPVSGGCELCIGAESPPDNINVLIVGDMIASSMDHLLKLLRDAVPHLPVSYKLTLKAHPGLAVDLETYPGLKVEETTQALNQILDNFDCVISANSTSAAVDAYIVGLPVIIVLGGAGLNLSPLRGQPGAQFVSTALELVEALHVATLKPARAIDRNQLFFLDNEIPRWKRLLSSSCSA